MWMLNRALFAAATIACSAIVSQPAMAQAYQCRMPARIYVPVIAPEGPARRMPVTGYTLALSWSPEFCKGRETQGGSGTQCSGSNGRFGFIVHGLWPEARGSWPQWCQSPNRLSPAEARRNMCMMPSANLIARQWVKHGSCMTRKPETYFKVTRILWNSLRFPDMDSLSRQKGLTAGDIRTAIASANVGIEAKHIGLDLDRNGWLEEVQICYGKRFRPTPCDRRRFGAANGKSAKIWRGG
jgi:ribonuclease T2